MPMPSAEADPPRAACAVRASALGLLLGASPALTACHPFQSAAIDETCEDLGTCAEADADTDTDTDADADSDPGWEPALGWSLSRHESGGAMASVHAAPSLDSLLEADSPDRFGGPLDWHAPSARLFVRSGEQLLVFGEDAADLTVYELGEPLAEDLAVAGEGASTAVFQATEDGLVGLDAEGPFLASGTWGTVRRLAHDGEAGLWVLSQDGDGADAPVSLVHYEPATDTPTVTWPAYDAGFEASAAGMTLDDEGRLLVCSRGGEARAVADLSEGEDAPLHPLSEAWAASEGEEGGESPDDIVACAWDPGLGGMAWVSASEGILGVAADGTLLRLLELRSGDEVLAARPW